MCTLFSRSGKYGLRNDLSNSFPQVCVRVVVGKPDSVRAHLRVRQKLHRMQLVGYQILEHCHSE